MPSVEVTLTYLNSDNPSNVSPRILVKHNLNLADAISDMGAKWVLVAIGESIKQTWTRFRTTPEERQRAIDSYREDFNQALDKTK